MIRSDPSKVQEILTKPEGYQDDGVWQYEHLRQICMEMNHLLVLMQNDCNGRLCQEMKVGEWLFLCAAHPTPQSCSAMDYMIHTLDGATALLNSNKHFPSRICIPDASLNHFQSIMRRIYRNFAHAWFQHKEIFIEFENETHLYERVVEMCLQYNLMAPKSFLIPASYKESLIAANVTEEKEGGEMEVVKEEEAKETLTTNLDDDESDDDDDDDDDGKDEKTTSIDGTNSLLKDTSVIMLPIEDESDDNDDDKEGEEDTKGEGKGPSPS